MKLLNKLKWEICLIYLYKIDKLFTNVIKKTIITNISNCKGEIIIGMRIFSMQIFSNYFKCIISKTIHFLKTGPMITV